MAATLDADGWARLPNLPDGAPVRERSGRCSRAIASFAPTIDMQRHGYGQRSVPLLRRTAPGAGRAAADGRSTFRFAAVARAWAERLGSDPPRYSADARRASSRCCHAAGQRRPTPLVLRYGPRRLERAAPGPLRRGRVSAPGADRALERGRDYEGGEVVLVEQRPRAQSRATTITVDAGEGIVFTNPGASGPRHARRPSRR